MRWMFVALIVLLMTSDFSATIPGWAQGLA